MLFGCNLCDAAGSCGRYGHGYGQEGQRFWTESTELSALENAFLRTSVVQSGFQRLFSLVIAAMTLGSVKATVSSDEKTDLVFSVASIDSVMQEMQYSFTPVFCQGRQHLVPVAPDPE